MTVCEEIGCPNLRYEHTLERDVCDQRFPEPEECPRIEERLEEERKWKERNLK